MASFTDVPSVEDAFQLLELLSSTAPVNVHQLSSQDRTETNRFCYVMLSHMFLGAPADEEHGHRLQVYADVELRLVLLFRGAVVEKMR
eukprot:5579307-Alexandrium_andersonii.AAC.1